MGMYLGSSHYVEGAYELNCGGTATIYDPVLKGVHVYGNQVEDIGTKGIQIGSAVENCDAHHNRITNTGTEQQTAHEGGYMINPGSVCDVYNNFITDIIGAGIYVQGHGLNHVFNNVIINPGRYSSYTSANGSGIYVGTKINHGNSVFVANNTIVKPRGWGILFNQDFGSDNLVQNNLVVNPQNGETYIKTTAGVLVTNNLSSPTVGEVKFTDPGSGDYSVQSGSPAVNAGTTVDFVTSDYLGISRPQEGVYDIGAYEYASGIVPTPTVTPIPWASQAKSLLVSWLTNNQIFEGVADGVINSLDWAKLIIRPPVKYAVHFDGIDDRVRFANVPELDVGSGDFSIEAWVKVASTQNSNFNIDYKGASSASQPGYWFWYSNQDDDLRLYLGDGSQVVYANSDKSLGIKDDQWHQVAVVADRSQQASFYLDGNLVGNFDISVLNGRSIGTTEDMYISSAVSSYSLQGEEDELRLWNYARTQQQIQSDMSREVDLGAAGLVGYWKFNEGSGTVVHDATGNHNDGSLQNGVSWVEGGRFDN